MKKNVYQIINNNATHNPSRIELLEWINRLLGTEFHRVEELCTGAAYCQLMHMLFPDSLSLHRVKLMTNLEKDFLQNFKILQASFVKTGVKHDIPVEKIIRGRVLENLQFLQWFKKFYDAHCGYVSEDYDARAVRKGAPMGFGPEVVKPRLSWRSMSAVNSKTSSLAMESVGTLTYNRTLTCMPKNYQLIKKISRRLVFEEIEEIEIRKSESLDKIDPRIEWKPEQGSCSMDCQKKIQDLQEEIQKLAEQLKCKDEVLLNSMVTIDYYRSKCRYIEILCESLKEQERNFPSCKQINKKIRDAEKSSRE